MFNYKDNQRPYYRVPTLAEYAMAKKDGLYKLPENEPNLCMRCSPDIPAKNKPGKCDNCGRVIK